MTFSAATKIAVSIIAFLALIVTIIWIYDLITPDWSILQLFSGLGELTKIVIS